MARGVTRTLEEKLQPIDAKIADYQAKIISLQADRKKMIADDRATKIEKVLEVADEKGLSIDELIKKISS